MSEDFYLAPRYQHLCPRCQRPCVKTIEGQLMDVSAQQVPTPWFDPSPAGAPAARRGTMLMDPRHTHVLLDHQCRQEDLEWAARAEKSGRDVEALIGQARQVSAEADASYSQLTKQYQQAKSESASLAELSRAVQAQQEAAALARPCPKCQAPVDTQCWDLRKARAGEHTLHPHAQRIDRMEPVEGAEQIQALQRVHFSRQDEIDTAKQAIREARDALWKATCALRRAGALQD